MDSSVLKQGSGTVDPDERPPASGETKACTQCHTTKTPLWRGGPCGPMTLCNACGIRYRKKRREAMGLDSSTSSKAAGGGGNEHHQQQQQRKKKAAVELRAVGFGKEAVLKQRRRMRRRRRLGEEERRAAILLMALSGVVYA